MKANLSNRQYAALEKVAQLSPGYTFSVERYEGTSSAATHVMVWKDGNETDYVGLVGKNCAQYYDQSEDTKKVVLRVAHRVYHFCAFFSKMGLT